MTINITPAGRNVFVVWSERWKLIGNVIEFAPGQWSLTVLGLSPKMGGPTLPEVFTSPADAARFAWGAAGAAAIATAGSAAR